MTARIAAALFVILAMSHFSTPAAATPADRRACWTTDDRYPCGAGVDPMGQSWRGEPLVPRRRGKGSIGPVQILPHPAGCARSLFCGCGVSAKVFGHPVRSLYQSGAWLKFPRASAAPGMVGWYPGHVAYIEQVHGDRTATIYDPNSGQGLTRRHRVPLSIFHKIVNPRPGKVAAARPELVAAPVQPAEPIKLASADPAEPLLDERPAPEVPAVVPELSPRDIEVAAARAYLKKIAGFGRSMSLQGRDTVMVRLKAALQEPDIFAAFRTALANGEVREEGIAASIDALHPDYALKLSTAVKDARAGGLPDAGPFSCYRRPVDRIGGMRDKAASCHAYGLVCDIGGIGRARSKESALWARYAARAGLYRPWKTAWEHNHWQLTPHKVCGTAAMRRTITPSGPKDLKAMWAAGSRLATQVYAERPSKRRHVKKRRHHTRVASR